jgi:hypothetical protein
MYFSLVALWALGSLFSVLWLHGARYPGLLLGNALLSTMVAGMFVMSSVVVVLDTSLTFERCTPQYIEERVTEFHNAPNQLSQIAPSRNLRSCRSGFMTGRHIMNYDRGFHVIYSLAPSFYNLTKPDWVDYTDTIERLEPYAEFADHADTLINRR